MLRRLTKFCVCDSRGTTSNGRGVEDDSLNGGGKLSDDPLGGGDDDDVMGEDRK